MSEGVQNHRPEGMFWVDRQYMVVAALVAAGAFPGVSSPDYERKVHEVLWEQGLHEPSKIDRSFAAYEALDRLLIRSTVSACEVNPW